MVHWMERGFLSVQHHFFGKYTPAIHKSDPSTQFNVNSELIVEVGTWSNIIVSDTSRYSFLYCVISLGDQLVKTKPVGYQLSSQGNNDSFQNILSAEWSEIFKFEIIGQHNHQMTFNLSIWAQTVDKHTLCLVEACASLPTILKSAPCKLAIPLNEIVPDDKMGSRNNIPQSLSICPCSSPPTNIIDSLNMVKFSIDHPVIHSPPINEETIQTTVASDHENSPRHHTDLNLKVGSQYPKVSDSDFERIKLVGVGSFGKVFQVKKKDTGQLYAMKVLHKQHILHHNVALYAMCENYLLKNIDHPFILSLKYAFQTKTHLFMVTNYLSGGELYYHLSHDRAFKESRARLYAAEILSAIGHLHERKIFYRDLKPENLVLDTQGHVCLIDFGLSKMDLSSEFKTYTICGSVEYSAPELFYCNGYGKEVDWWALGTLIYEMLSGSLPFYDEREDRMQAKILEGRLNIPAYFSSEAQDLIRKLLNRNPHERLGSGPNGTGAIRAHPWFSLIDWKALDRREIIPEFIPQFHTEYHLQSSGESPLLIDRNVQSQTKDNSLSPMLMDNNPFVGFSYDVDIERFNLCYNNNDSDTTTTSGDSKTNIPSSPSSYQECGTFLNHDNVLPNHTGLSYPIQGSVCDYKSNENERPDDQPSNPNDCIISKNHHIHENNDLLVPHPCKYDDLIFSLE